MLAAWRPKPASAARIPAVCDSHPSLTDGKADRNIDQIHCHEKTVTYSGFKKRRQADNVCWQSSTDTEKISTKKFVVRQSWATEKKALQLVKML